MSGQSIRAARARWTYGSTLAILAVLGACTNDTAERTAQLGQPLNSSPSITNFLLYAQRSVILGAHDQFGGGDIAVASLAPSGFGPQLRVGGFSQVAHGNSLLSPSVSLAAHSSVGDVQTNVLTNSGGALQQQAPYPFSLPPLPLTPVPPTTGSNVTVGANQTVTLAPGKYGALTLADHAVVVLQSGTVVFSSVSVGEHSRIQGDPAGATVQVAGSLTVGEWSAIAPAAGVTADKLIVQVAGTDGSGPNAPAVSFAPHTQLTGLLAAPHGTLSVGDHSQLVGAFAAFDVSCADYIDASFQSGFSSAAAYPHGHQVILGEVPPAVASGRLPVVGPVPGTQHIMLTIGLALQHQDTLRTLLQQLYDPSNSQYHRFVTPTGFADAFGPVQSDYDHLADLMSSWGFTIELRYANRYLLTVSAPASVIESTFSVTLNTYQRLDGSTFYAPANDPSADIELTVLHVTGFDSGTITTQHDGTGEANTCQLPGPGNSYGGNDLRNAYLPSCQSLTGNGQVIALPETDGFLQSDIQAQATKFKMTLPTITPVGVPSGNGHAPNQQNSEPTMDIDMVLDIAPKATILVYEEDVSSNPPDYTALLGQIASENKANIVAGSYAWNYATQDKSLANIFAEYAAQGMSAFFSAGDFGAYISPSNPNTLASPNQNAVYMGSPLIDTPLVTAVGGTILTTTASTATPPTAWASEVVWKDTTSQALDSAGVGKASGGGFATATPDGYSTLPIPNWQVKVNPSNKEIVGDSAASPAIPGNVSNARMVPDVSISAVGMSFFWTPCTASSCDANGPYDIAGCTDWTSGSSPLWGAVAALVNENMAPDKLGFANPALYRLEAIDRANVNVSTYTPNFHDITSGDNNLNGNTLSQYHAVAGYDLASGLGSPTCTLISNLKNVTCSSGGSPVNLDTDPNNCGVCNNACGTAAPSCCAASCVDLQTDPLNCGSCAVVCAGDPHATKTTCTAGKCLSTCATGYAFCGGKCIFVDTDTTNCGQCNHQCPVDPNGSPTCIGGTCGTTCNSAYTLCNGTCVDLQTSMSNCSSCGVPCSISGASCQGGNCVCQAGESQSGNQCCPTGRTSCGGVCVDLQTDPNRCGLCSIACTQGSGETCQSGFCACPSGEYLSNGHCCATGQGFCGGACIDITSDSNNCSLCGNKCLNGKTCQGGSCFCPPGQFVCNSACNDYQTDANNCGSCGAACAVGSGEICQGGTCVCPAGESLSGGTLCCPTSQTNCGGTCTTCPTGGVCQGTTCGCATGQVNCGGACVNEKTDGSNCGTCGHSCLGGTCSGGQCQPVVLASAVTGVGIAVDATNVYWTDQNNGNFLGLLESVPKAGGTVVTLGSPLTQPVDVALAGTNVYWSAGADPGGEAIFDIPKSGGTTSTFVQNNGGAFNLLADGKNLYWADVDNGEVFQGTLSGGTITTLVSSGSASAIAIDSSHVYWADAAGTSPFEVRRVAIGGGPVTTLVSGRRPIYPGGLDTDGVNIYWIEVNTTGTGQIGSEPVAGGTITTSSTFSVPLLLGGALLTLDPTTSTIYWSTGSSIMKAALPVTNADNPTTLIANTQVGSERLVVDDKAVYWISNTSVLKIAK